jgi:hypothetical protein
VTGEVDALALLPCMTAEEEEDYAMALGVDAIDDGVGEVLPASVGVGSWLGGAYGEYGVEEEDTPTRPCLEVAMFGDG